MAPHHILVFVFPGYETLDILGPLGLLVPRNNKFRVSFVSADPLLTPIPSNSSTAIRITPDLCLKDFAFPWAPSFDTLMIPGGLGTLAFDYASEEGVKELREDLGRLVDSAPRVLSVCSGSRVLARIGKLDGLKATSNKEIMEETLKLYPNVQWERVARWVHDGKFITSSGISAGMDAALYLSSLVLPEEDGKSALDQTREIAMHQEYKWDEDPKLDPFGARFYGKSD